MALPPVALAFVHFRTCDLAHFERAWWSVVHQQAHPPSQDPLMPYGVVFDNNSLTDPTAIERMVHRDAGGVVTVLSEKHSDSAKTHPYSVNRVGRYLVDRRDFGHPGAFSAPSPRTDWVLFTRSDYILAPTCVQTLIVEAVAMEAQGLRPFVSGWCWQSAYTRDQRDLPPVDPDSVDWRRNWTLLPETIPGYCFHETDQDAGVWLTRLSYLEEAGWMNEQLSAWGYAQSTFQRVLRSKADVTCATVPVYLFFHQHHGIWARDFAVARQQYEQFGGGE